MENWYIVQVKPNQQDRAVKNLRSQKIETLAPVYQTKTRGDYPRPIIKPLFPGYIFACFDLYSKFIRVSSTQGVRRLLSFGPESQPSVVEVAIIEEIKSRMDERDFVTLEDEHAVNYDLLRKGDDVRITSGPFRGLFGVFQREKTDKQRVWILMEVLGAKREVPFHCSEVERIDYAAHMV